MKILSGWQIPVRIPVGLRPETDSDTIQLGGVVSPGLLIWDLGVLTLGMAGSSKAPRCFSPEHWAHSDCGLSQSHVTQRRKQLSENIITTCLLACFPPREPITHGTGPWEMLIYLFFIWCIYLLIVVRYQPYSRYNWEDILKVFFVVVVDRQEFRGLGTFRIMHVDGDGGEGLLPSGGGPASFAHCHM